jgi:hypothetical protein
VKRRDFVIGTGAVVVVSALPRPVVALSAQEHVSTLLRQVAAGGAFATAAPIWEEPHREYYDLLVGGWRITMYRVLRIEFCPGVDAHVDRAFDPDGEVWDLFDWGGGLKNDPLGRLTEAEQAAFDRAVVADMRSKWLRP